MSNRVFLEIKNNNLGLMLALEKEGVVKYTGNHSWASNFEVIDEPYSFFCYPDHESVYPEFRERILIHSNKTGIHPEYFLSKTKNRKLKMLVLFNLDIFITHPLFFK